MNINGLLLGLAVIALMSAGIFIVLRKHRIIWNKIWEMDETLEGLKQENVEKSKAICMACINDSRLELKMPSQHGEDVWLWHYFKGKKSGFFVEVGAYDGVTFSNTYFLEAMGWKGVLVEPNPENFRLCRKNRPYSASVHAAVASTTEKQTVLSVVKGSNGVDALSFTQATDRQLDRIARGSSEIVETEVPALGLSEILKDVQEPIDVISIDVEGAELEVLNTLNFAMHAPKVFVIEDNSLGRDKTVPNYLIEKGYEGKERMGANILFARFEEILSQTEPHARHNCR